MNAVKGDKQSHSNRDGAQVVNPRSSAEDISMSHSGLMEASKQPRSKDGRCLKTGKASYDVHDVANGGETDCSGCK